MNVCPHDGGALSPITRASNARRGIAIPMHVAWICEHGHVIDRLSEAPAVTPAP